METEEQIDVRLDRERSLLVQSVIEQASQQYEPEKRDDLGEAQAVIYSKSGSVLSGVTEWRAILAVIACSGEVFRETDAERAVDAFGSVLVNAAWLLAAHRLAIGPVLDLARVFTRRGDIRPVEAPGKLALAALRRGSVVPGLYRELLVDALAYSIAKALDDCEMVHEITIDVRELIIVVSKRPGVLDRSLVRENRMAWLNETCTPVWDPARSAKRKSDAEGQLASGVQMIAAVADVETGDFCAQCGGALSHAAATATWSCDNGHVISDMALRSRPAPP